MGFLEHLEELRKRIIRILYVFLPVLLLVTTIEVHFLWLPTPLPGVAVPVPSSLGYTIFSGLASQLFRQMVSELVPSWVQVAITHPSEAISVQLKVGMFLATILTMPWMAYQLWMFVSPGLYHNEKRLVIRIVAPATVLFAAGAAFAYMVILPFAIPFLYGLGPPLGGQLFFIRTDDFLDLVLLTMATMGLAFQTPLIMWGLTSIGLVHHTVWVRYWRYAVVGFFFFGAFATPDGSGVTMLMVSLPMTALYFLGVGLAYRTARRRTRGPIFNRRTVTITALALAAVGVVGYWLYTTVLGL